ncbi:MAG: DUF456 domain-containing protein [Desulfoplanes sp.]|nr:DUF456 domain-containing protein [Desulfoplanes sp.]
MVMAVLFIILLLLLFCTHFVSLPANWFILGLFGIWKWTHPEAMMDGTFFGILLALAVVGEGLEYAMLFWRGQRSGGTKKGNFGAMVGAFGGAILGAPFFFGAGAIPGSFLGAWVGSLLLELLGGKSLDDANTAALGAMWGKVFGLIVKMGLGGVMLWMGIPKLFV